MEHLVYLTATVPDTGDSLASVMSGPAPRLRATQDAYVKLIADQSDPAFSAAL